MSHSITHDAQLEQHGIKATSMESAVCPISPPTTVITVPSSEKSKTTNPSFLPAKTSNDAITILYLCTFAILGSVVRYILAQIFGGACEQPLEYVEWLQPFQNYVCITSNGMTDQRGGALFIDLPANMIGCFLMGLLAAGSKFDDVSSASSVHMLWLHPDHYFQNFHDMHLGMRTGFCGSLTTFASWNTQMVIMMDGTGTSLGTQVPSSIFGYLIGLAGAFMSLKFGQSLAIWIHNCYQTTKLDINGDLDLMRGDTFPEANDDDEWTPEDLEEDMGSIDVHNTSKTLDVSYDINGDEIEEGHRDCKEKNITNLCSQILGVLILLSPFILVTGILAICMTKDYNQTQNGQAFGFYRGMWLSALFAPPGVFLRWKLSRLNKKAWRNWIPHGTLIANILGSMISISAAALATQYSSIDISVWVPSVLFAIKTGFAGSLSTVSTFVDEVDKLNQEYPRHAKAYIYSIGSLLAACVLSLGIYSPVVRW